MKRYNRSHYTPRSIRRLHRKSQRNFILAMVLTIGITLGLIFWGLPAFVGGLSIFNQFKPQSKNEILDQNAIVPPPVLNIPFEATNSPTIKISGYSSANSKVEIYFDDELKTTVETESDGKFQTEDLSLSLGTNNIYGKTINENGSASFASKNIKLIFSNEKPFLEVTEPEDNHQIKGGDKKVKIVGKTDPQNSLSINGVMVILTSDGSFFKEITINEGENTINIVATDQVGNSTEVQKKVTYEL